MIIRFDTEEEIMAYRRDVIGLEETGPLPAFLRIIASSYKNEDTVEIQIHRSLISQGYRLNPTMLGNNSQSTEFKTCQGRKRGEFVVVTYSKEEKPQLFKQLCAFAENTEMEEIVFRSCDVPTSYRENNPLLAYRIREATGVDVTITYDDSEQSYTFRKKVVDAAT